MTDRARAHEQVALAHGAGLAVGREARLLGRLEDDLRGRAAEVERGGQAARVGRAERRVDAFLEVVRREEAVVALGGARDRPDVRAPQREGERGGRARAEPGGERVEDRVLRARREQAHARRRLDEHARRAVLLGVDDARRVLEERHQVRRGVLGRVRERAEPGLHFDAFRARDRERAGRVARDRVQERSRTGRARVDDDGGLEHHVRARERARERDQAEN